MYAGYVQQSRVQLFAHSFTFYSYARVFHKMRAALLYMNRAHIFEGKKHLVRGVAAHDSRVL